MTATKTAAPSNYKSGHCHSAAHERCRGQYAGCACTCGCHTEPAEEPGPEPEPTGPRILSLFSGYGGLDLAVTAVLGGQVVAHAEIEPAACRILEHRFPGVPNLGDVSTVDWSAVEPVDVLCGGFPCQDVSAAGKRRGLNSETRSGLWAQMARAIDELRPSLVVAENVRGLLSAPAEHPAHGDLEPCPWCLGDDEPVTLRALGAVLGDLADIGYDAAWHGLRAADVGAPHGRFRVFVVAWPAGADADRDGLGGQPWAPTGRDALRPDERDDTDGRRAAADTDSGSLRLQPVAVAGSSGQALTGHVEWGAYEPAIRRWERVLGRVAPSPTELSAKGSPRLSPAFVEWLMGLSAGWVIDVPGLTRNEQLKALGNGVVPQQAAEALRLLLHDLAASPAA